MTLLEGFPLLLVRPVQCFTLLVSLIAFHIALSLLRTHLCPPPSAAYCPNTRHLPRAKIPVTIDAAFVRFVHTQSLAVQIWRGRARAWPRGGLCAGVARVELRSLLITLGGVGGNVSITSPPGNGDGLATGSIAVRLFFKHRGLGSSGEAPNDLGHENTVSEQERLPLQRRELQTEKFGGKQGLLLEAGAGGQSAEEKGASRITLDSGRTDLGTVFHTENVMGHSGTVTDGRTDSITCSDTAAPRAEGRLSLASMEFPVRGPVEVVPAGAAAESRTTWTLRQAEVTPLLQRPGSMPTGGGRDGGELRVVVERAMRLPLLPSSGIQRGGAVYGPTAESLPSTYVTFRWEEGGKPPVRSPFVSCSDGEVACTGGPEAASNGSEAWPVSTACSYISTLPRYSSVLVIFSFF